MNYNKIAIIDDDKFYRILLKDFIEDEFYCKVDCFESVHSFRKELTNYEIILLDLNFEYNNEFFLFHDLKMFIYNNLSIYFIFKNLYLLKNMMQYMLYSLPKIIE